jgi:hypothetical protein
MGYPRQIAAAPLKHGLELRAWSRWATAGPIPCLPSRKSQGRGQCVAHRAPRIERRPGSRRLECIADLCGSPGVATKRGRIFTSEPKVYKPVLSMGSGLPVKLCRSARGEAPRLRETSDATPGSILRGRWPPTGGAAALGSCFWAAWLRPVRIGKVSFSTGKQGVLGSWHEEVSKTR